MSGVCNGKFVFGPAPWGGVKRFVLFVCFVALRPKSTAMVIAGRSVSPNQTFSWAGLNKRLTSN